MNYPPQANQTSRKAKKKLLNRREIEILQLVACDLTDKEIAEQLSLSTRTINNNLLYAYAKLGVSGRAGAVATALAKGLIDPCPVPSDRDENEE